ncbi:hypothetical protein ZWY2020_052392 [Hordeum vulgare]|nr:hypothetical protein ZWY2020_052392 [Hordeum vulgare]
MWVACEIARLPEELVSAALARTSPRDAYRAAAVSPALRAVADSDDVWEGFLPPDGFLPLADGEPSGPAPPSLIQTVNDSQVMWPLARGEESRNRYGDGAKEDSQASAGCIAAAIPMEWRGSNQSKMVFLSLSFFRCKGIGTTIELESDEDGGHLVLVETSGTTHVNDNSAPQPNKKI